METWHGNFIYPKPTAKPTDLQGSSDRSRFRPYTMLRYGVDLSCEPLLKAEMMPVSQTDAPSPLGASIDLSRIYRVKLSSILGIARN